MLDSEREHYASICGLVAPIVALGAIFLSTLLASSATFTWRGRALSHMGEAGAETFWLFNGGLVAAGLIGIPFGWLMFRETRNRLEQVGVALLWIGVIGLVGVGVFFIGHTEYYLPVDLHALAALTVFAGAPFAKWLYASGAALAGDARLAIATFWLGIVHPMTWMLWLLSVQGRSDPMAWFAVPEMVAAVAFGGWIVLLAIDQLRGGVLRQHTPHNA